MKYVVRWMLPGWGAVYLVHGDGSPLPFEVACERAGIPGYLWSLTRILLAERNEPWAVGFEPDRGLVGCPVSEIEVNANRETQ